MKTSPSTAFLLREVVRQYARMQRVQASCGDGTSTVQCHVLNELLRQEGLTQQHLVERLGLDKGWISRAVDALVETDAVAKETDQADRRCVRIRLTPAGYQRATALDKTMNDHADSVLKAISPERHATIHQALQSLLTALLDDAAQKTCTATDSENRNGNRSTAS